MFLLGFGIWKNAENEKKKKTISSFLRSSLPLVKLFVLSIFLSIQFIPCNLSPTWSIFSAMQIFLHLVIFNHFAVGWIPAASGIYRSILCSLDLPWESTREGTLLIYGSQFDLFFCIFSSYQFLPNTNTNSVGKYQIHSIWISS